MEEAELEYRWYYYGIENVLDVSSVARLPKLLEQNPTVTVCEKLAGDTLCLSSKGWIGSCKRIIIADAFAADLSRETYKNYSLEILGPILNKLPLIAKELQTLLLDGDLQVLLYGEWLRSITRFNYKDRVLLPGQFRAFGLGIVPGANKEVADKLKLGAGQLNWNLTYCEEWGKPYYLVNLNYSLAGFLTSRGIEIVPVYGEFLFQSVFLDPRIFQSLFKRQIKGVILAWSEGILKWRSRLSPHQDLALIALEKNLGGKFTPVYKNLELVAFRLLGDPGKVNFLNEMYATAKEVLPTLEDFMQDNPNKNRAAQVYHDRIVDLLEARCQEPNCYLTYFVKIKEKRHYWVFDHYKEANYLDYFPSWYK